MTLNPVCDSLKIRAQPSAGPNAKSYRNLVRHAAAARTCLGDVLEGADLQCLFGFTSVRAAARRRHRGSRLAPSDLDFVTNVIAQFRGITRQLIGRAVLVSQHVISIRTA